MERTMLLGTPRSRKVLWLTVAIGLLSVLAQLAYAVCYPNIQVEWSDGSVQTCKLFCTFPGGWLCTN